MRQVETDDGTVYEIVGEVDFDSEILPAAVPGPGADRS